MYVSGFPPSVCRRLQMIAPWNGAENPQIDQSAKT